MQLLQAVYHMYCKKVKIIVVSVHKIFRHQPGSGQEQEHMPENIGQTS